MPELNKETKNLALAFSNCCCAVDDLVECLLPFQEKYPELFEKNFSEVSATDTLKVARSLLRLKGELE